MTPVIPTLDLRTPTGDVPIPLVGLGTWQLTGEAGYRAIRHALDVGYRHIDTATGYANQEVVGRAVADGIDRSEVFLTTKLPPDAAGRERATLEESLRALRTEYLDLWLVHWPPNGKAAPGTWQAFRKLRDEGLVRAIGVSNYSLGQIDELVEATGEAPAINQIPWSPTDYDPVLVSGHTERGVALEGYSPFKRTDAADRTLREIAAAHDVTAQQVIVAWHVRHRVVCIPKSADPERLERNLDISFPLSDAEVAQIDALGTG